MAVSDPVRDPVNRTRYTFRPDGENLIVDTWMETGGGLPAHMHPIQEERWSVVDGEVRFQLGRTKRVLRPADGEVVVAPTVKHGLANSSGREAHLRCQVIPALRLQQFLEESAAAAQEGLFTRGGVPKGLRGARWGARFLKRYHDETVMAFPPPPIQLAMFALLARGD